MIGTGLNEKRVQVCAFIGQRIEEVYENRGYRGHDETYSIVYI